MEAYNIQAGDIGFAHSHGAMGRIIRLGEILKGKDSWHQFILWLKGEDDKWNHEFVVDRFEDGKWYIIQAIFEGVTDQYPLDTVAPGGKYVTMAPPPEVDRAKLLEFCRGEVGAKYSILSDVAIGVDCITWNWVPSLMNSYKRTWNCSGLVNEGMRFAGWLKQWVNIYTVTPQDGYDAVT
jgi:hypothetical protein